MGWGPSADVADVAFIPGCGGTSEAAVGGAGGPHSRMSCHSLLLPEANPFFPQLLTNREGWEQVLLLKSLKQN